MQKLAEGRGGGEGGRRKEEKNGGRKETIQRLPRDAFCIVHCGIEGCWVHPTLRRLCRHGCAPKRRPAAELASLSYPNNDPNIEVAASSIFCNPRPSRFHLYEHLQCQEGKRRVIVSCREGNKANFRTANYHVSLPVSFFHPFRYTRWGYTPIADVLRARAWTSTLGRELKLGQPRSQRT